MVVRLYRSMCPSVTPWGSPWGSPRDSPWPPTWALGSPAIRARPATISQIASWRGNVNSAPTKLFARCTPWQFPVWNGETQPSRTLCARSPTSLWVIRVACIIRPPLFDRARRPALMRACSRPNSRSIGRGPVYMIVAVGPCPSSDTPNGFPLGG